MKYRFYKEVIAEIITLGVMPEEEGYNILFRIGDSGWTPQKVQAIIDKVENNRNLEKTADPYVWGNEDVTVFANDIGVILVDKMALRAKEEVKPLEMTHNEFIQFLNDFKEFVTDNVQL